MSNIKWDKFVSPMRQTLMASHRDLPQGQMELHFALRKEGNKESISSGSNCEVKSLRPAGPSISVAARFMEANWTKQCLKTDSLQLKLLCPITMNTRSHASTGMMGSKPTQGTDVSATCWGLASSNTIRHFFLVKIFPDFCLPASPTQPHSWVENLQMIVI